MTRHSSQSQDNALSAAKLADLEHRRGKQQRGFYGRQPKRVSNVIAQLVQRKGYAQVRAASDREEAWRKALEAEGCEAWADSTRVGPLKRGVLEIELSNSLMMQELSFLKENLLKQLTNSLPDDGIKQIKFRVANLS